MLDNYKHDEPVELVYDSETERHVHLGIGSEVETAEQKLTLKQGWPPGMEQFKPRPYQKSVMDNIIEKGLPLPSQKFGRHPYTMGIDLGQKDGDKTVVSHVMRGHNGEVQIYFDEFEDLPIYKWWRNPIKWYKWRKTWKIIELNAKTNFIEIQSTDPAKTNTFKEIHDETKRSN